MPAPLTDVVTPESPLEIDVFYSMRSPYSYLSLQRYTWLNSNFNVDVNIKAIFPIAVRTPAMFSGGLGGTEGRLPRKGADPSQVDGSLAMREGCLSLTSYLANARVRCFR